MKLTDLNIDKSWTLFLDRDGVINKRLIDAYVCKWEQFEFLPNVLEAIKILSGIFNKIIIVSNQQGIGKGLLTEKDLNNIHKNMLDKIQKFGGRVDKIYYSPYLANENSILRKPNPGMALKAKKEYPEINFKKSVMAGDSVSDLLFGYKLKMTCVFISEDLKLIRENHKMIDLVYKDLYELSCALA